MSAWQNREARDGIGVDLPELGALVDDANTELGYAFFDKLTEIRRRRLPIDEEATAAEIADWVKRQARQHYVADGEKEYWPTTAELLRRNGDDCDGMELLASPLLQAAGIPEDEIYRAIVYKPSDGKHHMATLWFPYGEMDPYVIDSTGGMKIEGLKRMSEIEDWKARTVFDEDERYSVWEVEAGEAAEVPTAHENSL